MAGHPDRSGLEVQVETQERDPPWNVTADQVCHHLVPNQIKHFHWSCFEIRVPHSATLSVFSVGITGVAAILSLSSTVGDVTEKEMV